MAGHHPVEWHFQPIFPGSSSLVAIGWAYKKASWRSASGAPADLAENEAYAGFPLCLWWWPFKTFCFFNFLFLNLFFFLAGEADAGTAPANALGTKKVAV
jgi:hypothetical protein